MKSASQAKNKSWFGILESYKILDSTWTLLAETSEFAQVQLQRMGANDAAAGIQYTVRFYSYSVRF